MKHLFIGLILVAFSTTANRAHAFEFAKISCKVKGLSYPIDIQTKGVDLPTVEFFYPVQVTEFTWNQKILSLTAVDQEEPTRLRIKVSAKYNQATNNYIGETTQDAGGHERQIDSGKVTCQILPTHAAALVKPAPIYKWSRYGSCSFKVEKASEGKCTGRHIDSQCCPVTEE